MRLCHGLWIALLAAPALANEGMWQPSQLPELAATTRELGLTLPASELADLTGHPLGAVIGLGRFCSASFVSPEGLMVTNHHCAFSTIQYNSTAEKNLMADGFVAADHAADLPSEPGLRVFVTERIEDVTARIVEGLTPAVAGRERFTHIDRASKREVAACEKPGGVRCDVFNFYGGTRFLLIRQLEIQDVRLVYAPSEKIGNFGDDVDNWMWPRHTGDFSFLRAYVGKDGKPAPYARDNVPYRPKHWLKIAPEGLADGEFAMVAGYPGRTNRTRLAEELDDVIAWQYPRSIAQIEAGLKTIDDAVGERKDAAIKYASTIASLSNGLKNMQGQLEGFARTTAVADKRAEEARLIAWIDADPVRRDAYAADVAGLKAELTRQRALRERDFMHAPVLAFGGGGSTGQLLMAARDLYFMARERGKPDADRLFGYQERDEVRLEARLKSLDRRYDEKVDRALLRAWVERYLTLPAQDRAAEFDAWLGVETGGRPTDLDARLDALYAGSSLQNVDERLRWFAAKESDFRASTDTLVRLAVALVPVWDRAQAENERRLGNDARWRSRYLDALIAYRAERGLPTYPDANGSLRVSIGKVTGYSPQDGVDYRPFTRLEGVLVKTTDEAPFQQPEAAVAAMREKRYSGYTSRSLDSVPVNFLTDLDITGGNSGSPTLNARGEFVGVVFDGNWESVSSNWVFNPALTRAIHADVRYILWVMDEVDGAERLIREMGLTPHTP